MVGILGVGGEGKAKGKRRTEHYQPLRLLDAIRIGLWISKGFPFCVFCFFDFGGGAVSDEDGFAAPFYDYLCASDVSMGVFGRLRKWVGGMWEGDRAGVRSFLQV
jgi:hypothetical protein